MSDLVECVVNNDILHFIAGFVQFIESQPLRPILERHRTIRQYLQSKVTNTTTDDVSLSDIGIPHDVLDAYVKSCG